MTSSFDIFGALGFAVIILIVLNGLLNGGLLSERLLIVLLLVGILGFIVDSVIVYKTYLKK